MQSTSEMGTPFESPTPTQSHMQPQASFTDSQGLGMSSNPSIVPGEVSESQDGMEASTSMSSTDETQSQPQKDVNMALLCRLGQETVQDIVSKTTEMFQTLKCIQPPTNTLLSMSEQEERKAKLAENLKNINLAFKKLRKIYEKCNESCAGMEYTHIEVDSLVPMRDEMDSRPENKKPPSDAMKALQEENKELVERVMLRNRQLKEVIDNLRIFMWEINTMLCMSNE